MSATQKEITVPFLDDECIIAIEIPTHFKTRVVFYVEGDEIIVQQNNGQWCQAANVKRLDILAEIYRLVCLHIGTAEEITDWKNLKFKDQS